MTPPPTTSMSQALFRRTLPMLDAAFATLVPRVPPPELVQPGSGMHFRSRDKTAAQAVIQKLSRMITGLRAQRALVDAGLYQEVGAMARILDELGEDVVLLSESVHILDSWGGDPPHFHLAGMRGTPREVQWEAQGLQYLYRGLTWIMYVAMAFGERTLIEQLYAFRQQFEQEAGMTDWPDPDQRVRELRQRGS